MDYVICRVNARVGAAVAIKLKILTRNTKQARTLV